MKKADIKEGAWYYVDTRDGWNNRTSWRNISYYQTALDNIGNKWTPVYLDGQIRTYKGEVRMKNVFGREEYFLFKAVRAPWIEAVVLKTQHAREDYNRFYDRGRKYREHLARKAKRQRETDERPIRADFYNALNAISPRYVSSWDRIESLPIEAMQAITEALRANAPRKEEAIAS